MQNDTGTTTYTKQSNARIVLYFITALVITGILIRVFVLDSFTVNGNSMAPTIVDGDYIFVNKLAYIFNSPQREDIVVGNFRDMESTNTVKRVVALPQQWIHINDGVVSVAADRDDEPQVVRALDTEAIAGDREDFSYRLDPHEYFLLGDNGLTSMDSRELGPVDEYRISGRAFARFQLSEMRLQFLE